MVVLRIGVLISVVCALAASALTPAAVAGGPTMRVGATADIAKSADPAVSQAEVVRAKAAGFDAIRLTQYWMPGQTEPPGGDLSALRNAVFAATANRMQVFLVVSNPGSRTTPLTEQNRAEYAQISA